MPPTTGPGSSAEPLLPHDQREAEPRPARLLPDWSPVTHGFSSHWKSRRALSLSTEIHTSCILARSSYSPSSRSCFFCRGNREGFKVQISLTVLIYKYLLPGF